MDDRITFLEHLKDQRIKVRQLHNALRRALRHIDENTHPALKEWSRVLVKLTEEEPEASKRLLEENT